MKDPRDRRGAGPEEEDQETGRDESHADGGATAGGAGAGGGGGHGRATPILYMRAPPWLSRQGAKEGGSKGFIAATQPVSVPMPYAKFKQWNRHRDTGEYPRLLACNVSGNTS